MQALLETISLNSHPRPSTEGTSKRAQLSVPPGMSVAAHSPSCCPSVRNLGALCQELEPETKYIVLTSEVLTTWNLQMWRITWLLECLALTFSWCPSLLFHRTALNIKLSQNKIEYFWKSNHIKVFWQIQHFAISYLTTVQTHLPKVVPCSPISNFLWHLLFLYV